MEKTPLSFVVLLISHSCYEKPNSKGMIYWIDIGYKGNVV